jgi:hypothetical protein
MWKVRETAAFVVLPANPVECNSVVLMGPEFTSVIGRGGPSLGHGHMPSVLNFHVSWNATCYEKDKWAKRGNENIQAVLFQVSGSTGQKSSFSFTLYCSLKNFFCWRLYGPLCFVFLFLCLNSGWMKVIFFSQSSRMSHRYGVLICMLEFPEH